MGKGAVGAGLGAALGAAGAGLAGFGLVGIVAVAGAVSVLGHEAAESFKYAPINYSPLNYSYK